MSLNETVLQKLADWHPPKEGRPTLNVPDEASGCVVRVTVDRQDELSCAVWELAVRRKAPAGATLGGWAQEVADRVTGLLEPLQVIEIDSQRNEALLRSQEAARRGQKLYYYEALLKGTEQAELRRYHAASEGKRREQVPFVLTHEVVAKVAEDMAAL
jgi:hypothetical protein